MFRNVQHDIFQAEHDTIFVLSTIALFLLFLFTARPVIHGQYSLPQVQNRHLES